MINKFLKAVILLSPVFLFFSCAEDKNIPSNVNFSFTAIEAEPGVTRLAYTDPTEAGTYVTTQWKGAENVQMFTYDSNSPLTFTPVSVLSTNNATATTKAVFSGTTTSKTGDNLFIIYPSLGATAAMSSIIISGTEGATEDGNNPMAHLDANNYMYTFATQADGSTLTLSPLMSMIRVQCTIPSGKTPKNLVITDSNGNLASEGKILFSFASSVPTIVKTKSELSLNFTNITSTSFYAYFMCLPEALQQDEISLKMTYTDNTTSTLDAGESNVLFQRGYRYMMSADFTDNTSGLIQKHIIPVVFHTIYGDATNSLQYPSSSRLQIIINNVNKLYADNGINVSFCLATKDPNGNILTEPGVDRLSWGVTNSSIGILNSKDPKMLASVWDITKYINIYTYTFSDNGVTGISTLPIMPDAHKLVGLETLNNPASNSMYGVCITNKYINNDQDNYALQNISAGSGINISCILAHELGHYLGLLHAFCDANDPDDYCDDTPNYDRDAYISNANKIYNNFLLNNSWPDFYSLFNRTYNGATYIAHNIMDYYFCYSDQFTADQTYRINYVLRYSPSVPGNNIFSSKVKTRSTEEEIAPRIIVCHGGR